MPHPLVIVAGVAIVVGASYMIYNEVMERRSQGQEEAYNTYCATMKAEKEAREKRLMKEKKERDEAGVDSDDQNVDPFDEQTQLIQSDPSPLTLLRRRRKNTQDELYNSTQENDYAPLIDLSEQCYPPRNTQSIKTRKAELESKTKYKQTSCGSSYCNGVIFAAPTEIIQQENPEDLNDSKRTNIVQESSSSVAKDEEISQDLMTCSSQPIHHHHVNPFEDPIITPPQAQDLMDLEPTDSSKLTSSPTTDLLTSNRTEDSNGGQAGSSSTTEGLERTNAEQVNDHVVTSNSTDMNESVNQKEQENHDHSSEQNENLKTSNPPSVPSTPTPTHTSPPSVLHSLDDGWSDLGSETFEKV